MTDERMGERLWGALDRLDGRDAGVVFRHYSQTAEVRASLAEQIAEIAARRGFCLAIARDTALAVNLGADLVHNPLELPCPLPFSRAVHTIGQAKAARAVGAALVFVSPIHPTRSHPEHRPLGKSRALRIVEAAGAPAIALGGMNARSFATLGRNGFYGWAGIDAFM
jgi:thiamine-phosphate pyrophosphorylase